MMNHDDYFYHADLPEVDAAALMLPLEVPYKQGIHFSTNIFPIAGKSIWIHNSPTEWANRTPSVRVHPQESSSISNSWKTETEVGRTLASKIWAQLDTSFSPKWLPFKSKILKIASDLLKHDHFLPF